MNFDKCLNEFGKYTHMYDLSVKENKYKYEHTLRVVEFAETICNNENFNDEEKNIALICSLLHDIARFEEWTKYNSWNEIDHGDLGYDILNSNDYILKYVDKNYKDVVLNTVKYHNKRIIPEFLDEFTMKMVKIVRDADKLDILNTQYNPYNEKSLTLNMDYTTQKKLDENIIDNFISEKLLDRKLVTNIVEDIIFYLSYIFDINYKTSFKIIYDLRIIDIKLELLKKLLFDESQIRIIELKIKEYMESKMA